MSKQDSSRHYRSDNGLKSEVGQDVLLEAITAVSASLDVNTILSQLAEQLVQVINATSAYIVGRRDDIQTAIIIAEYQSEEATSAEKVSKLDISYDLKSQDEAKAAWLHTAEPIVAHAVNPDLPVWRRQQMLDFKVKSSLIVPLAVKGKIVGYADIWESRYRRDFLPNEIALCEAISKHAAIVLSNAQIYESERRRRQEAEIFNEVSEYVTATLDLDEVVNRTLHTIRRYLVGIHSCNIAILEPDGDNLRLMSDWVIDPSYTKIEFDVQFKASESYATNIALQKRQPFWINDLRQYPFANARLKNAVKQGLCSLLYIPLLVQDRPIGLLLIHAWHAPRPFSQEEIMLCKGVVNQAALAIEHARLFTETRQQAKELALLNQVSTIAGETTEIDDLFQEATMLISENLYPELFGFVILDQLGRKLVPHSSFVGLLPNTQFEEIVTVESIVQRAINIGEPVIRSNNDTNSLSYLLPSSQSAVVTPIKINDRVVALICVESCEKYRFKSNDVRFLRTLAGQISTAMERAHLYETLRQQADTLARKVTVRTAELQAEKDRTLAILESAGEGIVLTDINGRILYVNPALEKQSGYCQDELLNQSPRIFNSGKMPDSTFSELWQTVLEGSYWSGEVINLRKDGTLYDVSLTVTPLRSSDGDVTGFVSVHADITRLKEVDRLKTQFTSTVTHELRTPLTSIKTYLSLLERGKPEKRDRYLRVLHEETDRLTRLIQDLLDLSRLETASPYNYETSVDPVERINALLPGFRAEADKRTILFKEQVSSELPLVSASELHFDTVLTNLLTNAFVFTPERGEVFLSIFDQGDCLQIDIVDNGVGVPDEELEKIFDRFFRGEAANDLGVPGTGLGLSIVKSIVERYGGEIQVTSSAEDGTRFSVWFPFFK
ncbi:MAG: GAF domain-containing protein [Chloroflexi bacterium]|nr:MAG: GAF domain-containing protein [Chloroflexota bacterium]